MQFFNLTDNIDPFTGISIDGLGNIFVAVPSNGEIWKRDFMGNSISLYGSSNYSFDLCFGAFGNLYSANQIIGTVTKLTPSAKSGNVLSVNNLGDVISSDLGTNQEDIALAIDNPTKNGIIINSSKDFGVGAIMTTNGDA